MANYVESIERFVEKVDTAAIDGLVKHLGIALHNPDSATVAVSDDGELQTIREGFCAKHLGMAAEEADAAIAKVAETMKHDTAKCRVTFYYLLAEGAGKLGQFAS